MLNTIRKFINSKNANIWTHHLKIISKLWGPESLNTISNISDQREIKKKSKVYIAMSIKKKNYNSNTILFQNF